MKKVNAFKNLYCKIDLVKPHWSFWSKAKSCLLGFVCFYRHRFDSILYLLWGKYPYQTAVFGKKILDQTYAKKGGIFISIHSGPFPLAGKILHDLYPHQSLVVPFYRQYKISIYPFYRRMFRKLKITVIALGGAMKEIEPVLKSQGSILLCLDADLPVKHKQKVTMFGHQARLSTGAFWLAKKYQLPIIPSYVKMNKRTVELHVLKPILYKNQSQKVVMQKVADKLAQMIELTLDQWQSWDRFLL